MSIGKRFPERRTIALAWSPTATGGVPIGAALMPAVCRRNVAWWKEHGGLALSQDVAVLAKRSMNRCDKEQRFTPAFWVSI